MKKSTRKKKDSFLGAPPKAPLIPVVTSEKHEKQKGGVKVTKPFIVGSFVVLLVILVSAGVYLFAASREDVKIPNTANLELEQLQQLIDDLGELMAIPEGEAPVMAIVSDATNLKSQPFFKNSQAGDRVMIFKSTKQAVLYRASEKKIIAATFVTDQEIEAFAALSQGNQQTGTQSAQTATPAPSQKAKVVVLNSTKEAGLARKGSNLLDDERYDVIRTGNSEGEYQTTTVVNVSKAPHVTAGLLNGIVTSFGKVKASIGNLPADEAAPAGADIVVLLGSDFATSY